MLKYYKRHLLIFILIYGMFLSLTHAMNSHSAQNLLSFIKSSYVLSLSGGEGWESAGQAQKFFLTPDIIKVYTADKPTNTLALGELFLGIKNSLPKQLEGQLGLAFIAKGSATLTGNIWDDADPIFDNFNYQYKINHKAIALKAKLLGHWNLPIIPWISASFGIGFNKAYGFNNIPTIPEAVKTPNFTNNTVTAFTYAIGVGMQKTLSSHWQIGINYEFADWGKSKLKKAAGQTLNSGLSLNHLYTNSVLLNLTYLA